MLCKGNLHAYREKGSEIMIWRFARAIYGVESCVLSALCSRELRSVTRAGRLHVLSSLSVASTCTTGHTAVHHHHGRPIPIPAQCSFIISTNHRLFRGTSGHTAMTLTHVSSELLYWTRYTSSSTFPACRFTTLSVGLKAGWICQHVSGLCQQWRTYAKKG